MMVELCFTKKCPLNWCLSQLMVFIKCIYGEDVKPIIFHIKMQYQKFRGERWCASRLWQHTNQNHNTDTHNADTSTTNVSAKFIYTSNFTIIKRIFDLQNQTNLSYLLCIYFLFSTTRLLDTCCVKIQSICMQSTTNTS